MSNGDWMLIGQVTGSFGVRGEVKVEQYTDFPERFKLLEVTYLGPDRRAYSVERTRNHKNQVVLKLRGVDSREDGDRLRGQEVYVPREAAMPLPEGHFYLEDAIGITVVTEKGDIVGPVTDVLRTGGNDVFVVNHGRNAVLVPVTKDAVRKLDLANRRATIQSWVLQTEESCAD